MSERAFKTLRSISIVGSGGVVAQVATALLMPVLSRLYLPESFGQWALLMSLALIPAGVAGLRYEVAIPLPDSHQDAANLLALAILLSLVVAAVTAVAIVLATDFLVDSVGYGALARWFWLIPFLVVAFGLYQAGLSWYTRMGDFSYLSVSRAILPLSTITVQIGLALFGLADARGLILGSLIGHFLAAALTVMLLVISYRSLIATALSRSGVRRVMIRYRNYPLYMTPYTLIADLRNRLAVFLFGSFGSKADVGSYALAERIVRFPVHAVSNAIRPVFFRKAAASKLRGFEAPLLRSLVFLNTVTTPFFVLFWFASAELFVIIFGDEWRGASLYAVILSVPMFVLIHTNWLDRGLDVLGRQKLAFQMESVFSVLSIVMLVFGLVVLGSVLTGVILQSLVILVYNIVWLITFFSVAGYNIQGLAKVGGRFITVASGCAVAYLLADAALPSLPAIGLYLLIVGAAGWLYLRSEWRQLRAAGGGST